ncbi:DUF2970 domain-containing protein [Pseudomonas sp. v388]|uniref:DUF2970 domain-containing protein n=1 Tax=Pseudomonas sp. v388 TaxID=2479849 RepID=UPI000F78E474|nr:DUF2970 domain-containing protein [Pseudomonas sp. v388]RRV05397.1 DUF2970 domain-containing protein [Pseudomonas sp. v388]
MNTPLQAPPDQDPPDDKPPTFWQMVHSVLAAALGVQSHKNRQRDFTHGKPVHFLLLGLLFTVLFVLVLIAVVWLVVDMAGV